MAQLWRTFGDLVPVLILVVAALAVTIPLIARTSPRRRRTVFSVLYAGWAICVGAVTLAPAAGQRGRAVELVPFQSIVTLLTDSVSWEVAAAQIGGNVLLFVPLGVLLEAQRPSSSVARRVKRAGLIASGAAVGIELVQYAVGFGRVASIDDVILAVAGALVGSLLIAALLAARSAVTPADVSR
ncbi:VanZ family protein [Kribbella sp. CA-253562]|uniref:VanZ family protein n=1 Tax=Kribbella sp. CA-253562 TaxID=3239942 RepID=UPI003D94F8F1